MLVAVMVTMMASSIGKGKDLTGWGQGWDRTSRHCGKHVVEYPDHAGVNGDAVDCGVEREKHLYGGLRV